MQTRDLPSDIETVVKDPDLLDTVIGGLTGLVLNGIVAERAVERRLP